MIDRRHLLVVAAVAAVTGSAEAAADTNAAACIWPRPNWQKNGFPSQRWVNILFVHTNERFKNIYFNDGAYIKPAIEQFSWTCRDFRANESKLLDPRLMDMLFVLHWKYCKDEIRIFSGYRSEKTNSQIEGAAKNSQHIQARALDIHLPNVDNVGVAVDFQKFLKSGVGMYPGQEFTHVDLGSLRRWVG